MTVIDHADFLDVRTLSKLASDAYEYITSDDEKDDDEVLDAEQTLRVLGLALKSFNRDMYFPFTEKEYNELNAGDEDAEPFVYGEDIAELWEKMGDNLNVTLVADGYLEDYIEEQARDFGWIGADTPDFIVQAINWSDVIDTMKTNNSGGELAIEGRVYWIGM